MWVDVPLRCPNDSELLALTRVREDGKTESAGSLEEKSLRDIAPILKAHIEHVEEFGGDWEPFEAARAILHHVEVVL